MEPKPGQIFQRVFRLHQRAVDLVQPVEQPGQQEAKRRAAGEPRPDAMHGAVLHVGRAVANTSIALALGFGALTLSSWRTISAFGGLAAVAIACALVSVVVVLPALMTLRPERR